MRRRKIETEVIVVGGGLAGALAAITAGRYGAKVVLIEKDAFLGGVATGSMLSELNGVGRDGEVIYGGVMREIMDNLVAGGHAEYHFQIPMSSALDKPIKIDRLRYNPDWMKIVLESLAVDAGVKILYNATATDVQVFDDECSVIVEDAYDAIEVRGQVIVDATGNAEMAYRLGLETEKDEVNELQATTLYIRLTNVDIAKVRNFVMSGRLAPTIKKGFEMGILPAKILGMAPIPNTTEIAVNVTRTSKVDHERIEDFSRGVIESRQQIPRILPFLRENVDGLEKAVLSSVSPVLGVRSCRRIVGRYFLTGQDLLEGKDFEDAVALGAYPIDIHTHQVNGVFWQEIPGVYKIPLSCMLPHDSKRFIVAGRCVSADRAAFAAIRVSPIVMAMGEAVGHAVETAVHTQTDVGDLNVPALRHVMRGRGVRI